MSEVNLDGFLSTYFGASFDRKVSRKWRDIIRETETYFKDGSYGGYSSLHCEETWNDSTLENDADLKIFDLLFKIDIQNGAHPSKIVNSLFIVGAFDAVKVKKLVRFS